MPSKPRIVVVDDDFLIVEYLSQLCEDQGWDVVGTAGFPDEAVDLILATRPTHLLLDLRLGGGTDGVEVALELKAQGFEPTIIFVTGSNEPKSLARIHASGPHRILVKPIHSAELIEAIQTLASGATP